MIKMSNSYLSRLSIYTNQTIMPLNSLSTGIAFSVVAITLNLISNLSLNRSFYPLFFLQLLYQIVHDMGSINDFWRSLGITFADFSQSEVRCLDGDSCKSSFIFKMVVTLALIIIDFLALFFKTSPFIDYLPNNNNNSIIGILFNILQSIF